jgi:hypothetical protein
VPNPGHPYGAKGAAEVHAQPLDVAVDGPVVHILLIDIGCVHQGVAAFHHPSPARQRLQDEKFSDGERHRLVFPGARMPFRAHAQLAAFDHWQVGCHRNPIVKEAGIFHEPARVVGVPLVQGPADVGKARELAIASIKAIADQQAANVLPAIRDRQRTGGLGQIGNRGRGPLLA